MTQRVDHSEEVMPESDAHLVVGDPFQNADSAVRVGRFAAGESERSQSTLSNPIYQSSEKATYTHG
jgi:hypothetical protein